LNGKNQVNLFNSDLVSSQITADICGAGKKKIRGFSEYNLELYERLEIWKSS
jgi:hypothetical protein